MNVPVPDQLLADIRAHPDAYGVAHLASEARRLQHIFQRGAEAVHQQIEDAVMAHIYDTWASDAERERAITGAADVLLAEGGGLDLMLRQTQALPA